MALFMLLQTGLMGVFCALDFILFYVFWEVVLLPMYFLIGMWGGPRRIYAAIKFFIYTVVGSVLMLLAILAMYFATTPSSFNILSLTEQIPAIRTAYPILGMTVTFQALIFLAFFIGFAIKVPVFPFHTWLPDAHVEAPTAVSVVLAGVLLKMGGYGLFRIAYPIASGAALTTFFIYMVAILGIINIVYGAFCAMAQKDFKSLVAYSSISHMGYVLVGLAAITFAGVEGAALQMFNHGVSSAMMFLLVGVLYERAHHRDLNRFGGVGIQMPYYTGLAIVGFFAALGLPGLNGFISEAMVLIGAFGSEYFARWVVYVAVFGIILTAAYILWTVQRVYLVQPKDEKIKTFKDLNFREAFCLIPLAFLCVLLGVWPKTILVFMDSSMTAIVETIKAGSRFLAGG
jgi:NADH-quinone oxidoreductase subunit M